MARQKGLEPLAYCLEGSCSIRLSYWREFWMEQVMRIELASPAWKAGALTIVLHLRRPHGKVLTRPGNRQLGHHTIKGPGCQAVLDGFPANFGNFFSAAQI